MTVTVRRMWPGGPLRQMSDVSKNDWTIDDNHEYRGLYMCDECQRPVLGLYEPKHGVGDGRMWLCSDCRTALRPKQEQPRSLRK